MFTFYEAPSSEIAFLWLLLMVPYLDARGRTTLMDENGSLAKGASK